MHRASVNGATHQTSDSTATRSEDSATAVYSSDVDCHREIPSQSFSVSEDAVDSGNDGVEATDASMFSKLHNDLEILRIDLRHLHDTEDRILRRVQVTEEALLALAQRHANVNIDNHIATLERPMRSIHRSFDAQEQRPQVHQYTSFDMQQRAHAGCNQPNFLRLLREDMARVVDSFQNGKI
ncbi:hypothetical protein HDU96_005962 [Phlyctochytrium bullatum]|nr:hypothetical protein HDU96_005962 [Phlyctochytrium bullatum]